MILSALLAVSGVATPPATRASSPLEAARAHLAAIKGGEPAGWRLLYERSITALDGSPIWVGKLIDKRGALQIVYRAADGAIGGQEVLAGRNAKAIAKPSELTAKADRALVGALASSAAGDTLPVAVWLSADPRAAVAAVIARHPDVEWRGERPVVDDLATMRALRAELDAARAGSYGSAETAFRGRVETLGGKVGYASTNAPLLFVDLPASRVAALAGEAAVTSLGLEAGWAPAMSVAGPTVDANWTSGAGDQGTGIRVGVVEYHNVRNAGDLAGRVVASHSTTGSLAYASGGVFDHPTWVAGAIAGQSSSYRGVAPGALIVSSGTGGYVPSLTADRAIVAAADWAINASGGNADIINTSLVQDTATGADEARRFFDAIAYEGGRLPISAAGNFANGIGWQVGSPGSGYNVLTVGGVDDRGTASRSDDRIWYVPGSNGSNFLDPPGTAWNPDGDFNKPDVTAPAVGVRTANGLAASGTSVATPIVAGIAAQLMARAPKLAAWPEAIRSIIMAGAMYRTPMPDGSLNVDHGGAGSVSALWANRILGEGDGQYGGSTFATLKPGDEPVLEIAVTAGQRIRVALAWSSHTSGGTLGKSDQLTADLDLEVTLPGGTSVGSYSLDNANEWVDFTSPTTGTARIQVLAGRFDAEAEPYGLAWAKVPVPVKVARLSGADRYGTAAAIVGAGYATTGGTVYVATGAGFADALAAGPAAAVTRSPILLVTRDGIPTATAEQLHRLAPSRIVVAGGGAAVSPAVEKALRTYAPVIRLAGADRYATSAGISAATFDPDVPVAFVATGADYPDALAGGAAAGMLGGPMLLTRPDGLPAATVAELKRLRPAEIVILGGTGAIKAIVEQQLRAIAPVTRISGGDRYETAAAVVARYFSGSANVWLATGLAYPDALAAAPLAAVTSAPLLLTRPTSLPAPTIAQLLRLHPSLVYVAGGTSAVGVSVINAIRAALDS